jgi:hypothetical protein
MVLRQFVKRYGWGSSLGDRHEGRIGASILANAGLTDFIAQDIDGINNWQLRWQLIQTILRR